jgi:hypothetical protein
MGIKYPATGNSTGGSNSGTVSTVTGLNSFRNKIINGDFKLDYIGGKTLNNAGDYFCNRWYSEVNNGEIKAERSGVLANNSLDRRDTVDFFGDGSGVSLIRFNNVTEDLGNNTSTTWQGTEQYTDGNIELNPKAVKFSGDNAVSCSCNIVPVAMSMWVYLDTVNSNNSYLIDFRNNSGNAYVLHNGSFSTSGVTNFRINNVDTKSLGAGKWAHIYFEVPNADGNSTWYLGNYTSPSSGYSLNGRVQQFRIFNRSLSADEIDELINKEVELLYLKYYGQITINSVSDNSNFLLKPFVQKFEQQVLQQIQGGKVTLSFNFACSQTGTFRVKFVDYNNNEISQTSDYNDSNNDFQKINLVFDISNLGDNGVFNLSEYYGGKVQIGVQDNANDTEVTQLGANDWLKVTDVQLEKGDTTTDFENRPIQIETALCNRYMAKSSLGADALAFLNMRTAPTINNDILDAEL